MSFKRILTFFLIIFLLGLLSYFYPHIQEMTGQTINQEKQEYPKEPAILERVIDGDTIEVLFEGAEKSSKIRLLGINTPEKKMPYCNESANLLKQFINQTVYLQRDFEDEDKYKRKLRYLFINDSFLNIKILELGYANSYYTSGLNYEQELLNAEKQARESGIGIWTKSSEKCAVESCISLVSLNATEEFFIIRNNCGFDCDSEGWFVKDAGRNTFYLDPIDSGEEQTYNSKNTSEVWNNNGDKFFMFDEEGKLVLYQEYFS